VHPIDEESPLFSFTQEDYHTIKGEVLVFVKAFDDMYSSTVVARTSYTFDEFVYGAKFIPMFDRSKDRTKTILMLDKLNHHEKHTLN
jgi:hypothetical protein